MTLLQQGLLTGLILGLPAIGSTSPDLRQRAEALFRLAINKEDRAYFEASIEHRSPPLPRHTLDKRIDLVLSHSPISTMTEQRRAVLVAEVERGARGIRKRDVRQWYDGTHYRSDENDSIQVEATLLPFIKSGQYAYTIVDLHDPRFSPYARFTVNRILHTVQLDRNTTRKEQQDVLWMARSIEPEMLSPILSAMSTLTPDELLTLARQRYKGLQNVAFSPDSVAALAEGSHGVWRMEVAIDEHDGPTRHSLYGTLAIGNAKYEVVADYYIKQENGKMLFLSGSVANQTLKREYFTSRSNFDGAGFPWTWSFKLAAPEIGEEYTDISFKKVEYPASFSPAQVYKVPDPKSHEKFTIVDISLKEPNVLHRPPAFKKVKRFDGLSSKTIIFGGMTFFTAIALWFLLKAPRKTAA